MLNLQQQQAINSPAERIIINASAGTGKTSTLIAAAEQHKFGSTILITFTNKAAEEIQSRISYKPEHIGTIHSFAYRELLFLARKYNFRIRVLKDRSIKKIIKLIFDENDLGVYPSATLLSEAYQYIINDDVDFDTRKVKIFQEVERLYLQYKEQQQLFDLTDTPKYLLKKLIDYNIYLSYDLVLVDEAQDLDDTQYQLIQRIGRRTIVIGDPRQSIYMFRGATPAIFNKFIEDGYEYHTLDINYRSKQEVIDNAGIELTCDRGNGGKVFKTTEIFNYGPQVLCRTNKEVELIKRYYPSAMTIHAAKGLEFNNVCVVDFELVDEEAENVMFVALTRARDRIAVLKMSQILPYLFDFNREE